MTRLDAVTLTLKGLLAGLVLGLLLVGAAWGKKASAQDAQTDLALLMRGVIPQVSVTVDGATTFAISPRFPWSFVILACTGAETINTITGGRQGTVLYIEHLDSECTLADDAAATAADAMNLTGAGNDAGATGKVIVLIHNGSHWYQVTESAGG